MKLHAVPEKNDGCDTTEWLAWRVVNGGRGTEAAGHSGTTEHRRSRGCRATDAEAKIELEISRFDSAQSGKSAAGQGAVATLIGISPSRWLAPRAHPIYCRPLAGHLQARGQHLAHRADLLSNRPHLR